MCIGPGCGQALIVDQAFDKSISASFNPLREFE